MRNDEHFPFCSDRCRLIDLGKWASGVYKVSSPVLDPDLLEESGNEINRSRMRKNQGDDEDSHGSMNDGRRN